MLFLSFLYAALLIAVGVSGLQSASAPAEIRAFAMPGLFSGGAILLSSFFAIKERRHGLSAASFLGFLAFLTNFSPLVGHFFRSTYDWHHPAHRTATLVSTLSACYLVIAFLYWKRARRAAAIAELEDGE